MPPCPEYNLEKKEYYYLLYIYIFSSAPPEYPGVRNEAPIDMRLRSKAPPPYNRPSVIKSNESPPGKIFLDQIIYQ